uniref:Putative phosphatidylinositol transfer protein n=1 Tax=Xenopsylla cheopis TaxID=163159 RepID=A0A6M2DJ22_XENCH
MVLIREYRICLPLTVEEYRVGQLYMIARHSHEQSNNGEGVEVVINTECEDPVHGKGRYTEKRIHLNSRLPYWLQSMLPKWFYLLEKSWNYFPFTKTEYSCSFVPKFNVSIITRYEDNNGSNGNCLNLSPEELAIRTVDHIDIAYDEVSSHHYSENEDPKYFKSSLTSRGPLVEGWRQKEFDPDKTNSIPIMCCYKLVKVSFEVWGLQTRVEEFVHKCIRETLLLGHRQAFTWIDEWYNMSVEDVYRFEEQMQNETNERLRDCLRPDMGASGDFEGESLNEIERSVSMSPNRRVKEVELNKSSSTTFIE